MKTHLVRKASACLMVWALFGGTHAVLLGAVTPLVFNLGTVMTGDSPASAMTPWLTATFSDAGSGKVYLDMAAVHLSGNEDVKEWAFNIAPGVDFSSLKIAYVSGVGFNPMKVGISKGEDAVSGFAGFKFDFDFGFPNGNPAQRFTQSDHARYLISLVGGVLDPSSFDYVATGASGIDNWYTAAHIRNTTGPLGSGKIGAPGPPPVPVPEPATYVAGVLLLLPILVQLRRWRRSG